MKRIYFGLIVWAMMAAACGGAPEEAATTAGDAPPAETASTAAPAPEPTATAAAAATATATAVPTPEPTATAAPTATPDVTADFTTFRDAFQQITLRYPPDWALEQETNPGRIRITLASDEGVKEDIEDDDFSRPAGFVVGEIELLFGEEANAEQVLQEFLTSMPETFSLTGEPVIWEQEGMQFASQTVEGRNESGAVLVTFTVMTDEYQAVFVSGTTAVGADQYQDITQAIVDSVEIHMRLEQNAPPPDESPASAGPVNFLTPTGVLQAVFQAAQMEQYSYLADLCDPLGENDRDTQMICDLAEDETNRASFVEYFAAGKIDGEARISPDGNTAEVPFLFGPDGNQKETMKLIKRNGRWYLFEF